MPRLEFERDGAAILENVVGADIVEALREEFAAIDFLAGARPFALSETVARLIGVEVLSRHSLGS